MGQLILGEQAAPATPGSGVTVYTTVATPSILRVKDDGGNDWPIGAVLSAAWPTAPVVAGSSTAGTQTYSTQLGYYIKIGALVIAWVQINMSAKDAATAGNISINNLPFTARSITNMRYAGSVGLWTSTATTFVTMLARVSTNTTAISLFGATAATATPTTLVAADISATTSFTVTVMYEAA
jgi:hypothetical protein